MDRNLPVEVMIWDIEDVKRFLLSNPSNNMELTYVQLCTYGLIKLSKTGPSARYGWNSKPILLPSTKRCSPQMEEQPWAKRGIE